MTVYKYTLHARRRKSVKRTTFDTILRRVNFALMFFLEKLASLLSARKPFSGDLKSQRVKKKKVTPHVYTDFFSILLPMINLSFV